jgi:predicted transcriptional regulator
MTLVFRVSPATVDALDQLAERLSTPINPKNRSDAAREAIEAGVAEITRRILRESAR